MNTYDFERFSVRDKWSNSLRNKCSELHSTPQNIAFNMVYLLFHTDFFNEPDENITIEDYIRNHRLIDVYCKSGSILLACYNGFMFALRNVIPDRDDRDYFIVKYLLFGLCPDVRYLNPLRDIFYYNKKYDLSRELGNFYHYDLNSNTGSDKLKVEELLKSMEFDVVVGNPPYNNDAYIDFVLKGHELAKSYDLWITPAKFIGMQSDLNVKLRTMFKSCCLISKYFDKAIDIFNIQLDGGICYYLNGKTNNNNLLLNGNKVSAKSLISFDNDLSIILAKVNPNLISSYNSTVFETCKSYFCSKQPTEVEETKGSGYYLVNDRNRFEIDANFIKHKNEYNNYKVFCVKVNDTPLAHILSPDEVYGRAAVLLGFGDKKYCESIKSFFETRTIWYLVYFSGCGNINTASFRFVPNPGSFDCIFEDKPLDGYTPDENGEYIDADGNKHCSLYVKYKLTQQEIDVIESVIRERK